MSDNVETLSIPAVTLEKVSFSIDDNQILSEVSFKQPVGTCTCIIGGTGCGKTTVLKIAGGLIVPDSGAVLIHGKNIFWFTEKQEEALRKVTGFVFQNGALWQNMSVFNNVALPLQVHFPELPQKEVQKRVRTLVEELGYYETLTVRPAELSVGEQKLIAIARALITDPEIVFMDDPTANLDDDSIEHVFNKITKLRKRGTTLLIATNNEELLYRFADYIGVMKLGKLETFGCYEEIIENTAVSMKSTLQRLKRRGKRACAEEIIGDGSEMSNRSDV